MEEKIGQIATWLADKKGTNITALDVRGISPLTEAMIFVTARSAKHFKLTKIPQTVYLQRTALLSEA